MSKEVSIVNRINDLKKEGIWSDSRLPKCAEPKRTKTHCDYVLEEMMGMVDHMGKEKRWRNSILKERAQFLKTMKNELESLDKELDSSDSSDNEQTQLLKEAEEIEEGEQERDIRESSDSSDNEMDITQNDFRMYQDQNLYIDMCLIYLYSLEIMTEDQLPKIYVPPQPKKPKLQESYSNVQAVSPKNGFLKGTLTNLRHRMKMVFSDFEKRLEKQTGPISFVKDDKIDEPVFAPCALSYFDSQFPALIKQRKDFRYKKLNAHQAACTTSISLGPGSSTFPITTYQNNRIHSPTDNFHEWTVYEDHHLLKAVTGMMEVPLSLHVVNLAQVPNWKLAANVVNTVSRIYRTAEQCKYRYENVIVPREERKLFPPPRSSNSPIDFKRKKMKTFIKTTPPSSTNTTVIKSTAELLIQNNNGNLRTMMEKKCDAISKLTNPQIRTIEQTNANSKQDNYHLSKFAENKVDYGKPVNIESLADSRLNNLLLIMQKPKLVRAANSLRKNKIFVWPLKDDCKTLDPPNLPLRMLLFQYRKPTSKANFKTFPCVNGFNTSSTLAEIKHEPVDLILNRDIQSFPTPICISDSQNKNEVMNEENS